MCAKEEKLLEDRVGGLCDAGRWVVLGTECSRSHNDAMMGKDRGDYVCEQLCQWGRIADRRRRVSCCFNAGHTLWSNLSAMTYT